MHASADLPIAFAGTPGFAVPTLRALQASGARIDCVLTQPDRPAGRGRKLKASPVKDFALEHGLRLLQPERIDDGLRTELPARRPRLLVVVAYGLILPQWLLDWPEVACVNVHASLLPRWRGASPIQQAILAGDPETGISLMRMTRGLDTGPVYRRQALRIAAGETASELHDRLAEAGAALLLETLPSILAGEKAPEPQDESQACYAPRIAKRDARLDWNRPALQLERQVRAFNPWPVAETRTAGGERLRIWRAEALGTETGGRETGGSPARGTAAPGSVLATSAEGIDVATAAGVLRLQRVQPPGGREMEAAAWIAAHPLEGRGFVAPD